MKLKELKENKIKRILKQIILISYKISFKLVYFNLKF